MSKFIEILESIIGKKIIQKPGALIHHNGKANRSQAFGDAREQFSYLLKEKRAEMEKQKAEQQRELNRELREEEKTEKKEAKQRRLKIITSNDIDPRTMKLYPDYMKRRKKRKKAGL